MKKKKWDIMPNFIFFLPQMKINIIWGLEIVFNLNSIYIRLLRRCMNDMFMCVYAIVDLLFSSSAALVHNVVAILFLTYIVVVAVIIIVAWDGGDYDDFDDVFSCRDVKRRRRLLKKKRIFFKHQRHKRSYGQLNMFVKLYNKKIYIHTFVCTFIQIHSVIHSFIHLM